MRRICITGKCILREITRNNTRVHCRQSRSRGPNFQTCSISFTDHGRMTDTDSVLTEVGKDSETQETTVDESKKSLSKRALKKLERLEKWKQKKSQGKAPKSRKPGAPEPGFGAHLYQETEYYFENGLRKVYPYYYTFTTYVKQRWIGRTILEVFTTEFRAHSEENYRSAIDSGQLTVNGNAVSSDYRLKDNELLAHRLHRHENPVVGCPIEVLVNTDDLIVINKPSSIPCHPCGKYRHNSIVFIVGRQLGCSNLRNIYRLDRLTSGVLIMGKTTKTTKQLEDQILNRQVSKEYVCRVVGEFPEGTVECKEPIGVISQKLGLFRVREDGKPSHTTFEKISYHGKTSVVRCRPHTGRTHQIRVHLQFLGHPIVNDPFYNSEAWGPNKNKGGVMERTDIEVSDRLMELHNIGHWTDGVNPLYAERLREIAEEGKHNQVSTKNPPIEESAKTESAEVADSVSANISDNSSQDGGTCVKGDNPSADGDQSPPNKKQKTGNDSLGLNTEASSLTSMEGVPSSDDVAKSTNMDENVSDISKETSSREIGSVTSMPETSENSESIPPFDRRKWIPAENCQSCQQKYVDPTPSELVMFLHALRYSGPGWEYSTPLPNWAKDDWDKD